MAVERDFTPVLAKHRSRSRPSYFEPHYQEFRARTIWSLSNAFTSAFKELEPIPQFKATAKLGEFLEADSPSRSSTRVRCGWPPLQSLPTRN
jgi:hypothetical protein